MRPKTRKCYTLLFRTFIAFCVLSNKVLHVIDVTFILCFLEFLVKNAVSVHMLRNYVSAIKANLTIWGCHYELMDHPNIRYFIKSVRINRPLAVTKRNIIDIKTLNNIVKVCDNLYMGKVFKAVFLCGFFGFLHLSNIAPHCIAEFDTTRHLAAGDVFFTKRYVKLLLKWSKTMQNRDKAQIITLPRLKGSPICLFSALRTIFKLYSPQDSQPLFQINTARGWQVLTDSRIRKCLASVIKRLGFSKSFFTFHSFRRSGATLAFNSHVPLLDIKWHGSWSSDCVWTYIKQDHTMGENVADSFIATLA